MTWHAWLDAEMDRIWVCAERELRRLQQLGLRPQPNAPMIAEIEAALAERRAELASADAIRARIAELRPHAMRRFARLGLTDLELEGALLVAAPSIDPVLADLFAVLRGAALPRRGVDVALIGVLLGGRRDQRLDLLRLLDEDQPLLAHRLVLVAPAQDVYSSASYRSMQPTPDLLWLLTGDASAASPSLRRSAELVRRDGTWDGLVLDAATRAWLEPLGRRCRAGGELPWIALWGHAGSGKRELSARLAGCAGRAMLALDPSGVDKAALPDLVRRAARDAAWLGAALYLGPLGEDQLHDQRAIVAELERCVEPVFLGIAATRSPRVRTVHPLAEYPLPIPQAPERVALWHRELAGAALAPGTDIAAIARGSKLVPGEIIGCAREARALATDAPLDGRTLRGVVERCLRNELGTLATRVTVTTTWDDIILPADAIARVKELISRKQFEDRVYREWGLDRRIGYGKGIVGLFSGPPGTGKTLLAGLIAKELGLELYQVDLSQVFSRWLGEAEKALARVFDQAERAHAVLLFDEADALFAKRTEVDDSRDRHANATVNFLLQRLERYSGVAILTTNKDTALDEALARRLSLHLHLDEPEVPERLRLWEKHLPADVPGADMVDLAALAEDFELSGGTIKNVAVRASFQSAADDVPLSTARVRRAAILELEDQGRVVVADRVPELALVVVDYVEG